MATLMIVGVIIGVIALGFGWLIIKSIFESLAIVFKLAFLCSLVYLIYYSFNEISKSSHSLPDLSRPKPHVQGH